MKQARTNDSAAWQTAFHLLPRRAIATAPPTLTREALSTIDWWDGASLPADYRDRFAALVPPAASKSPDLEVWGTEDGNRIEVRSVAGRPMTVRARVDVRQPDAKFAAGLLTFVRAADTVLVRADGTVIAPTPGAFGLALRGSTAWRFVKNPAYVDGVRPADDADE